MGERIVDIVLTDEDYEYTKGHVIDGRTLVPATSYILLVWETIGMLTGRVLIEMPIVFKDVKFVRATQLAKQDVELTVMLQKGDGYLRKAKIT